ncbi:MAG: TetR/AcrR family transcriptional regulator [Myxococcota bacterium]|nr:TetR/AcrR family transcriptional regulator [Myxococcota bacterium]
MRIAPSPADASPDRRRDIVEAAVGLFNRYGYKRTSVDSIAREAGVAKATFYAYFPGKDDVFRAVCVAVCDRILEQAAAAAERAPDLESRLRGVLEAKLVTVYELVDASPHAREILDSQTRIGADIVESADREYVRRLGALLADADRARELDLKAAGHTPSSAAQLLVRSAHGAAHDTTSTRALQKQLRDLVRLFLRALEPR